MRAIQTLILAALTGTTLLADTGVLHRHQIQAPVKVEMSVPEASIPFEMVDGRPVVEMFLEGQGPYKFIFDTGAGGTLLEPGLAADLDLSVKGEARIGSPHGGEPLPAKLVMIEKMSLGPANLTLVHAVVGDLSKRLGSRIGPLNIFSPRMLAGLLVTLDFARGVIILKKGELPPADGLEVFDQPAGDILPGVPVSIGDVRFTAHIDSGNRAGLDLPKSLMEKLTLAAPAVEGAVVKTISSERPTLAATVKGTLAIGRHHRVDPEVRFLETPIANIGSAVLKNYLVTLDVSNRRIRLQQAGGV